MSKSDKKMPLELALPLAEKIKAELEPVCEKIVIAGSIGRGKPEVGDLEIICIPKFGRNPNTLQLGENLPMTSLLEVKLNSLMSQNRLERHSRAKNPTDFGTNPRFLIPSAQRMGYDNTLDLYISNIERWAVETTVRRGNWIFAKGVVTQRAKGGLLPDNCEIKEDSATGQKWQVFQNDELLVFEDEPEFVRFCVGQYVPPCERELNHWSELSDLRRRIYSGGINAKVAA